MSTVRGWIVNPRNSVDHVSSRIDFLWFNVNPRLHKVSITRTVCLYQGSLTLGQYQYIV